jgi:hypothetical protein
MSSSIHRTYTVARGYRRMTLVSSVIALGLGGAALVLPLVIPGWMPRTRGDLATVCVATVLFGGLGVFGLRQCEDMAYYAFTPRADGFRMDDRASTEQVPWSEIVRVRERRFQQRVELLDATGRVRGRLEFQVARFEEALAAVLRAVPVHEPARTAADSGRVHLAFEPDALVIGAGRGAERIAYDALRFAVVGRRPEARGAGLQLVLGLRDGRARCVDPGPGGAITLHRALVRACPRLAGEDTTRELWAAEFDRKAS